MISQLDPFLIKLILSFLVGAVWITLATLLAEKYGSKIGGILIGLPSTIVISLFFIAWTQGVPFAIKATDIVPVIEAIDIVFILIYVLLLRFNFGIALLGAFIMWFVGSLTLVYLEFDKFWLSIALLIPLLALAYYILERRCRSVASNQNNFHYTFNIILARGFLSGMIIAFAVLISKWGGPLLGGAFAAFPAAYASTMFITYFARGKDFSAAVMKSLMLSGGVNITIYVIVVRYTYLLFGLLPGTLLAFVFSLISGYGTYLFVQKKMT